MESKTATALGAGIVSVITPLVFPQIPLEAGAALYSVAAGLFIYAGRDWIRTYLPGRWRLRPEPAPPALPEPVQNTAARSAWIALDDAIRYLAKGSQWGAEQKQHDPHLSVNLGILMRDALACGELTARGRKFHVLRGGIKDPPLHPLIPIPRDFWEQSSLDAYWPLQGRVQTIASRGVENVVRKGDHQGMHDLRLNRDELEALWPPLQNVLDAQSRAAIDRAVYERRRLTGGIGDPLAMGARLLEQDREEQKLEAKKAQRRGLIEKGRNVVHRFRLGGEDDFETFASKDRDYLDVQPHLGAEYQAWRTNNAGTIFQELGGRGGDDFRAAMLLRELARLEREWNLA